MNPLVTIDPTSASVVTGSRFWKTVVVPHRISADAFVNAERNSVDVPVIMPGLDITERTTSVGDTDFNVEAVAPAEAVPEDIIVRCAVHMVTPTTAPRAATGGHMSHAWCMYVCDAGAGGYDVVVFDSAYKRDARAAYTVARDGVIGLVAGARQPDHVASLEAAVAQLPDPNSVRHFHNATFEALQSLSTCTRWSRAMDEVMLSLRPSADLSRTISEIPRMKARVEMGAFKGGGVLGVRTLVISTLCAVAVLTSTIL